MLAAEYPTLPTAMQDPVRDFFAANESWLCTVLEDGRADGTLRRLLGLILTGRVALGGRLFAQSEVGCRSARHQTGCRALRRPRLSACPIRGRSHAKAGVCVGRGSAIPHR